MSGAVVGAGGIGGLPPSTTANGGQDVRAVAAQGVRGDEKYIHGHDQTPRVDWRSERLRRDGGCIYLWGRAGCFRQNGLKW